MNNAGTIPLRNPLVRSRFIRGSMFTGRTGRGGGAAFVGMSHTFIVAGRPDFSTQLIGIPAGDPYQVTILGWNFRDYQIYNTSAQDILQFNASISDQGGPLFQTSSGHLEDGTSDCFPENMHNFLKPAFNFSVDGVAGVNSHSMALSVDTPGSFASCDDQNINALYFFHFPETKWYDVELGSQFLSSRQIYPSAEPDYPHSLIFDGQDDWLNGGPLGFGSQMDEFTVEFLVKSNVADVRRILRGSNANGMDFIINLNMDVNAVADPGNMFFQIRDEGGDRVRWGFLISPGINDGTWHRISITKDVNNNVRAFVDGNEETVVVSIQELFNNPQNFDEFAVGAFPGPVGPFLDGSIGDIRCWSQVRTPQQIADSAFVKLDGDEAGLFEYYPFTTGRGNILRATVNVEYNADIVGAKWSSDTPIGA